MGVLGRARAAGLSRRVRRLAVAAALILATAPAGPAGPAQDVGSSPESVPLTLENIYRGARGGAGNPVISPDGKWVAFTARGTRGAGLYRLPVAAEPPGDPQWWTESASDVEWAPDSSGIVFVRSSRLWWIALAEEKPRALTSAMQGLRDPVFSPDGRTVAFYSTEGGAQDIWLVSLDGGEARRLTSGSMSVDDGRFAASWSPDGTRIAFVSNKADYWADDVWVVEVKSGSARQLSRGIVNIGPRPVWSPRGDQILVAGTAKRDYWYLDLADLFLVDPASGAETRLAMPIHATAYNQPAFWSADGRRIFFVYQERGEHYLWAVPAVGGVATRVSHIGGVMSGLTAARGAEAFAFARSSATEGSDIYYLPATGGPERRLTHLAPRWAGLQEPIEVSFPSFDGLYIQGFLYLPPQARSGQRCPALVQVHGGGTNSYMRGLNLTEQYLASRGYVVLAINYRGGSGFGRAFQDLAIHDWLNGQALDPGAAADYLRRLPYVNGKVGIYGGSYGGMQTMAAMTRTPEKFDAAVPMRGIYSQTLTFDLMDRVGKIFSKTGHGGLPQERPEIYAKSNTIDRFANIRAPVLIMHGERDDRAPYRNFELAVAELRRLGKPFESRSYPGEGHGFRNPDNQIDMYRRLESFFEKHLGRCVSG